MFTFEFHTFAVYNTYVSITMYYLQKRFCSYSNFSLFDLVLPAVVDPVLRVIMQYNESVTLFV